MNNNNSCTKVPRILSIFEDIILKNLRNHFNATKMLYLLPTSSVMRIIGWTNTAGINNPMINRHNITRYMFGINALTKHVSWMPATAGKMTIFRPNLSQTHPQRRAPAPHPTKKMPDMRARRCVSSVSWVATEKCSSSVYSQK